MSASHDPPRLIDDPSGGWLQQALDASRAERPGQAQLDGLWERIVSTPPGGPEDGGAPDGGAPDGGAPDGGAPPQPPAIDPTNAATASSGSLLSGAATKLAVVLTLAGALVVSAASGTPDADLRLSSGWSAPTQVAAATLAKLLEATPPELATLSPDRVDRVAPSATQRAPSRRAAASPAPPGASDEPKVDSEIAILMEARAALASSPTRALALVDHAAKHHPRGNLGQERNIIRVQALARLGRRADALAVARALVQRHPGSAYARRLATLFPEL